jgi:hypothetical protein
VNRDNHTVTRNSGLQTASPHILYRETRIIVAGSDSRRGRRPSTGGTAWSPEIPHARRDSFAASAIGSSALGRRQSSRPLRPPCCRRRPRVLPPRNETPAAGSATREMIEVVRSGPSRDYVRGPRVDGIVKVPNDFRPHNCEAVSRDRQPVSHFLRPGSTRGRLRR